MLARVATPVTLASAAAGLRGMHAIAVCGSCLAAPADQGASFVFVYLGRGAGHAVVFALANASGCPRARQGC